MFLRNKRSLIILIILSFLILCSTILTIELKNTIKLKDKTVILSVGEEYKEPGYKISFLFLNLENKLKIESNINTNQAGTYNIKYKVKFLFFNLEKKREVIVKDNVAPELTLTGDDVVTVCPKKDYIEEGYKAFDNNDGDITEKVEILKEGNTITYIIKDSSGNITSKTRTIKKEDNEKPKITLKGNKTVYLTQGENYVEPGFTANDNCDGSITNKVNITGSVNKNKIGSYTLTYKVKDNVGNEITETRKVYIEKKQSGGVIYLTFDDGPSNTITPKVLDILKEENVKATFFVIHHSKSLNKYIKRAYDEGHTVALHSYTHNYKKIYSSKEAYFEDLEKIRNEVYKITGEYSNIIRFPGGSSNTVSRFNPKIMTTLAKEVGNRGYIYFDWNISSGDAGGAKTKTEVFNNVTRNLTRGSNIVLLHDKENNYITLNALKDIIQYAKLKGYKFDKITQNTIPYHHKINN